MTEAQSWLILLACSAENPGCFTYTCSAHNGGCCPCRKCLCGVDLLEMPPRLFGIDIPGLLTYVSGGCCMHCGCEVSGTWTCECTHSPVHGPPCTLILTGPLQTHIGSRKNRLNLVLASVLACIPLPAAAQARGTCE